MGGILHAVAGDLREGCRGTSGASDEEGADDGAETEGGSARSGVPVVA